METARHLPQQHIRSTQRGVGENRGQPQGEIPNPDLVGRSRADPRDNEIETQRANRDNSGQRTKGVTTMPMLRMDEWKPNSQSCRCATEHIVLDYLRHWLQNAPDDEIAEFLAERLFLRGDPADLFKLTRQKIRTIQREPEVREWMAQASAI
jgi:hypothetical protein